MLKCLFSVLVGVTLVGCIKENSSIQREACFQTKIKSISYTNPRNDNVVVETFDYDDQNNLIKHTDQDSYREYHYNNENHLQYREEYLIDGLRVVGVDSFTTDENGQIIERKSYEVNPDGSTELDVTFGYLGDMNNLVKNSVTSNTRSGTKTLINKYFRSNSLPEKIVTSEEDVEVYVRTFEYDSRPNFMIKSIHFFLRDPSNWSAYNVLRSTFEATGNTGYAYDPVCVVCDFSYEYDPICGYPTHVIFGDSLYVMEIEYE